MIFKTTTDTSSAIYSDALSIRKTIFIEEQHVDESLEIDELEEFTLHIVGYLNDSPACTARLYKKEDGDIKVQRVAVLKPYRNQGTGHLLMAKIEQIAKKDLQGKRLVLDSQDHAIPFYEKCQFTVQGDGFLDANIPHHFMQKEIDKQ